MAIEDQYELLCDHGTGVWLTETREVARTPGCAHKPAMTP